MKEGPSFVYHILVLLLSHLFIFLVLLLCATTTRLPKPSYTPSTATLQVFVGPLQKDSSMATATDMTMTAISTPLAAMNTSSMGMPTMPSMDGMDMSCRISVRILASYYS